LTLDRRTVHLADGRSAPAVVVRRAADVQDVPAALGLPTGRPTLVVAGGAARFEDAEQARLARLVGQGLIRPVVALGATVVDGGTDAGVMRLVGRGRADANAGFPLVGVAAVGTVALPRGDAGDREAPSLEPHHTHFVLAPGDRWGDEAPWIADLATVLAGPAASLTVLVNGGPVSWRDVAESVRVGRPVLVIAGSGGTADALAAAARGGGPERAAALVASGLVATADAADPDAVDGRVRALLGSPTLRTES
jgi:hypothetical protein